VNESCILAPGWRRLLKFDAATINYGSDPVHIGNITGSSFSQMAAHNVYEWSPCHMHYHFQFYANYTYGLSLGRKQGWCMESIVRTFNNEFTPLNTDYWKCGYQGIYQGWGDEYIAGIECQWIDITDVVGEKIDNLGFQANPAGFLCEGIPVVDSTGNFIFDPSPYKTQIKQLPVDKPRCNYRPGYDTNNYASTYYFIPPSGSMINDVCSYEQLGEKRDCGWVYVGIGRCTPGQTVNLDISQVQKVESSQDSQVVRVCDYSRKIGAATACVYVSASRLGDAIVTGTKTFVSFTCPSGPQLFDQWGNMYTVQDSEEPGGYFSVYSAPYASSSNYRQLIIPQLSAAYSGRTISWTLIIIAAAIALLM
jgi:hypothetical protein